MLPVYQSSLTYIGPDGRQVQPRNAGTVVVQPGAVATVVAAFDGAKLGGRLVIETFEGDDYDKIRVEVPVPASRDGRASRCSWSAGRSGRAASARRASGHRGRRASCRGSDAGRGAGR